MEAIKAIETNYLGYRFRSRLEARWAVFFHTLGIEFEYEKEGFELPAGRYLPDFWLPHMNAWIEIKPLRMDDAVRDESARLLAQLCMKSGQSAYLLSGSPGMVSLDLENSYSAGGYLPTGDCGVDLWWARCNVCGEVGLTYLGNMADLSCGHVRKNHYFARGGFYDPELVSALERARGARFEFGEKG